MHSVALVGNNGAGKSTLLSAIPFALFGECRTGDMDKEVNFKSKKARVSLVFSSQGQKFKVTRERTRPRQTGSAGKSQAYLERFDDHGQQWDLVTNGVRQVNAEVESLIGANVEVLMSSVFASQGDTGRFTSGSKPQERREVLFRILSLTNYAQGADLANEKRRLTERDVTRLEGKVAVLTERGNDLANSESTLLAAEAKLDSTDETLEELQERLDGLRSDERSAHKDFVTAEATFAAARDGSRKELASLTSRSDDARKNVEALRRELELIDDVEKRNAQASSQITELTERHTQLTIEANQLDAQIADLAESNQSVSERMATSGSEIRSLRDEIVELETRVQTHHAETEALDEDADVDDSEELEEVRQQLNEKAELHQIAKLQHAALEGVRDHALQEIEGFKSGEVDECRICGQGLDHDAKENTLVHDIGTQREFQLRIKKSLQVIESVQKEHVEVERDLQRHLGSISAASLAARSVEEALALREGLQAQTAELEARLVAQRSVLQQSEDGFEEVKRSQQQNAQEFADVTKRRAEVGALIEETVRTGGQLRTALAETPDTNRDAVVTKLDAAHEHASEMMVALSEFDQASRLSAYEATRDQAKASHEASEKTLTHFLERKFAPIEAQREQCMLQVSEAAAEVKAIEEAMQEGMAIRKRIDSLNDDARIMRLVESATGAAGIPSLILDDIISDLSAVSSDLLEKLTHSRFTLEFQTTSTNKSGKEKSSLEIVINDGSTSRSYETFSGGEKMRIDIAVRIGLSVMLARRSGAPLEFLTIDEGFGALDADGIQVLTTALGSLRDRFGLIMVVTHIPEVAQAFPARIELTRASQNHSPELSIN